MPWGRVPELVDTYEVCTSLKDLETFSEFCFAFSAPLSEMYSYVPAPVVKWSWLTGAELLEFVPMLCGFPPVRLPLH